MLAIGKYWRSSSLVVGVTFAVIFLIGVAFVAYYVQVSAGSAFDGETEAALDAELIRIQTIAEAAEATDFAAFLRTTSKSRGPNFLIWLTAPPLLIETQAAYTNVPAWPNRPAYDVREDVSFFRFEADEIQGFDERRHPLLGYHNVMAKVVDLPNGQRLWAGRSVADLQFVQWIGQTFGTFLVSLLLGVSAFSIWLGFYVVSRINRITETTHGIVANGDFSTRLPVDSSWDDLSRLSAALNQILDDLEDLIGGVKSVSDNIAHDLRTPISRLRADIDQLTEGDGKDHLLKEVDGILSIFNSLLAIADVEATAKRDDFSSQSLTGVVTDAIELYGPVAEEKRVELICLADEVEFEFDRNLMFQATANLIDNAVKFTPPEGRVTLTLSQVGSDIHLEVCDTGSGIPEQHRDLVSRRFYRIDESRTASGNGLGLALVSAVVDLHDGMLSWSDNPESEELPGCCCRISFKGEGA